MDPRGWSACLWADWAVLHPRRPLDLSRGGRGRYRPGMRLAASLILVLLFAAGCGRAARDFEDICHAEQRADLAGVTDPAERAMRMAQWIDQRLRTREARRGFQALAAVRCEDKGPILVQAAREAGYTGPCPMVEASARQCEESAAKLRELQKAPPAPR